jgi:hypothetical protein
MTGTTLKEGDASVSGRESTNWKYKSLWILVRMSKQGRVRDEGAPGVESGAVHTDESTLAQEWPFATDFNDHFETPKVAYRDIRPLLRRCARSCGVEPAKLRVYDPYFCR